MKPWSPRHPVKRRAVSPGTSLAPRAASSRRVPGPARSPWRAFGLALGLLVAWFAGCASLPDVSAREDGRAPPQVAQVSTAKGPLTREQSAAILEKLRQQSGATDILQRHVALEEAVSGSPLVAGNKVTLLKDGPATYRSMFEAIARARDSINLEIYIFEDDEVGRRFAQTLMDKQSKGVQVNVIYDSLGSVKAPREFFDRMREAGIKVLEYGPINPLEARKAYSLNHRDHRKLLIVDGSIVFTGGINISAVYSSSPGGSAPRTRGPSGSGEVENPEKTGPEDVPWRDTHVRLEGPIATEFQKLFLDTWERQHGEPLPQRRYLRTLKPDGMHLARAIASRSDDPASPIYVTLISAIDNAEKSIDITVAYFLPDEQLVHALSSAAARGVKVRLVLPGQSDFWAVLAAGRSHYAELLKAGIGIYERRAALLHAKTVMIDSVWSTIGSTNLDPRSFLHNDEANVVVLGYDFASQMGAMFEEDVRASKPITREDWERRPVSERMKEWAARLWEYWM